MKKHESVDLYSDHTGGLYLVIDEQDAWQLHADPETTFEQDAHAILTGEWYPSEEDGQRSLDDEEWERETCITTTAIPLRWLAELSREGLTVEDGASDLGDAEVGYLFGPVSRSAGMSGPKS